MRIFTLQGIAYVATANGWNLQGTVSLAGRCTSVIPGEPWWASIAKDDWPEGLGAAIHPLWDEVHGDRQTG